MLERWIAALVIISITFVTPMASILIWTLANDARTIDKKKKFRIAAVLVWIPLIVFFIDLFFNDYSIL